MELKSGYKQTEVGLAPEDWEVISVGDLISSLEAGTSVNSVKETEKVGREAPSVLKTSCIFGGRFSPEDRKIIVARDVHRARLSPLKGTIIISRMNTPALVGECGYVSQDYPNLFLPDRLWMTLHSNIKAHSVRWLAHLLSSKRLGRTIRDLATGTSGSMKNISKGSLLGIQIASPPTKTEQQAIANALSDADALIASLEQLLAKKRRIKQGTMQELLTGKKRLPGFGGDWEVRALRSEIEDLQAGMSVNAVDRDHGSWTETASILKTSCVEKGIFTPSECKRIVPQEVNRARLNPRNGTIIISRMNTIDLVGECGYVGTDYPTLFVPDRLWITRFREKSEASPRWLAYILSSRGCRNLIKSAATGTSGSMKNISKSALLSIEITFPSLAEQAAIATILSDMDTEISALETKLAKVRQIKQGMMQELLTGRIRLV